MKTNSVNVPYRKQYDENGKLLPLENGVYLSLAPNRKTRHKKPERLFNNSKNFLLKVINLGGNKFCKITTILHMFKNKTVIQYVER
jgi:hypothetical protein